MLRRLCLYNANNADPEQVIINSQSINHVISIPAWQIETYNQAIDTRDLLSYCMSVIYMTSDKYFIFDGDLDEFERAIDFNGNIDAANGLIDTLSSLQLGDGLHIQGGQKRSQS